MKRINWNDAGVKGGKTYSVYYVDEGGRRVYVAKGVTFSEANRESSAQRHFLNRECTLVQD